MNPLRRVVSIGEVRVGPRGGRHRLCTLECGHLKAWNNSQGHRLFAPPRFVPQRMRCLLCGIGCAPAPLLDALTTEELSFKTRGEPDPIARVFWHQAMKH